MLRANMYWIVKEMEFHKEFKAVYHSLLRLVSRISRLTTMTETQVRRCA